MVKHIKHIEFGHLKSADYQELLVAMKAAYTNWQGSYWTIETINKLINKFPARTDCYKSR